MAGPRCAAGSSGRRDGATVLPDNGKRRPLAHGRCRQVDRQTPLIRGAEPLYRKASGILPAGQKRETRQIIARKLLRRPRKGRLPTEAGGTCPTEAIEGITRPSGSYRPVKSVGRPLGIRLQPPSFAIFLSICHVISDLCESTYSCEDRFFLNRRPVFEIIPVLLEVRDSQGGRKSYGNVLLQHLGPVHYAQEEDPHPGDCQLPGALLSTAGCISSPIDACSAPRPAVRRHAPAREPVLPIP
jgi:hypothetical protein